MKTVLFIAAAVAGLFILYKQIDQMPAPKPAHQITLCVWMASSYYLFQWLYLNKGMVYGNGHSGNIIPVRCNVVTQEAFMPTLQNFSQWSTSFKFFFFVTVITFVLSILVLWKREKKWIFLSLLNGLIATLLCFLMLAFAKRMSGRLDEGLYFIKLLLYTTINFIVGSIYSLGLCGTYILPLFLVAPNTMSVLMGGNRSAGKRTSDDSISADEEKTVDMPNIVYDSANNRYRLVNRFSGHAVYQDDDGNTVTIYHADVTGSTATTSAGNFHWY